MFHGAARQSSDPVIRAPSCAPSGTACPPSLNKQVFASEVRTAPIGPTTPSTARPPPHLRPMPTRQHVRHVPQPCGAGCRAGRRSAVGQALGQQRHHLALRSVARRAGPRRCRPAIDGGQRLDPPASGRTAAGRRVGRPRRPAPAAGGWPPRPRAPSRGGRRGSPARGPAARQPTRSGPPPPRPPPPPRRAGRPACATSRSRGPGGGRRSGPPARPAGAARRRRARPPARPRPGRGPARARRSARRRRSGPARPGGPGRPRGHPVGPPGGGRARRPTPPGRRRLGLRCTARRRQVAGFQRQPARNTARQPDCVQPSRPRVDRSTVRWAIAPSRSPSTRPAGPATRPRRSPPACRTPPPRPASASARSAPAPRRGRSTCGRATPGC